jgi:predicted RNA-binding protein with PIN domain
MSLLIDGYNLLNVTGIFVEGGGDRAFERTRFALLNFIAHVIDPRELPRTVVVFDAANAPRGLPRVVQHAGLTARFASDYDSADALLEELIQQDHSPRQLTVISSDHRVQRAARRRRATAIDSEIWYARAIKEYRANAIRKKLPRANAQPPVQPQTPLSKDDVQLWLAEFSDDGLDWSSFFPKETGTAKPTPKETTGEKSGEKKSPSNARAKGHTKKRTASHDEEKITPDSLANPFPPGYADDIL